MKTNQTEIAQRYLLLFKLDAKNLFERINERRHDFIEIFSLKRNRSVFKDIFSCRYEKASVFDLSHCPLEVIEALEIFYSYADEIYWYLKHTEDMPNTIEDEVTRKVIRLEKLYKTLALYIDASLSGEEKLSEVETFEQIPSNDIHYESFVLDGEVKEEESALDFIQPENYPEFEENNEEED